MKLNDLTEEQLELMSHADIAYYILEENKKAMLTPALFQKVSDLLSYSADEYANNIGDFYTSLTTDKRFVLLETNEWDLRDKHSVKIVMDEEDEEIDEEEVEIEEEMIEDDEIENIDSEITDDDLTDDDLEDLSIVDDEEDELSED